MFDTQISSNFNSSRKSETCADLAWNRRFTTCQFGKEAPLAQRFHVTSGVISESVVVRAAIVHANLRPHQVAIQREGDVGRHDATAQPVSEFSDDALILSWNSKLTGWNDFRPSQTHVGAEDEHHRDVVERYRPATRSCEELHLQPVDVARFHKRPA